MKVKEIFDLGMKMGIKADPRGQAGVKEYLDRIKKEYEESKPKDKKFFDKEKLENPYSDSRIHVDNKKTEVKKLLAGIDIESGEVLLASQLGEKQRDKKVDLVISHHPLGKGFADLHAVMDMQIEVFEQMGVPVHVAERLMQTRVKEVTRGLHPANHYQVTDIANLLKINLINTHTFTDNLVQNFLNKYLSQKKPKTVGDIIDALCELPEYEEAKRRGAGPMLFAGHASHRTGKYMVGMTGGTSPSEEIYSELSKYGISTVVDMHMKDTSRKKAEDSSMNVIIAGHYASDSLGMNLFLDELEKKGIEIVPVGGLIRVSRNKK